MQSSARFYAAYLFPKFTEMTKIMLIPHTINTVATYINLSFLRHSSPRTHNTLGSFIFDQGQLRPAATGRRKLSPVTRTHDLYIDLIHNSHIIKPPGVRRKFRSLARIHMMCVLRRNKVSALTYVRARSPAVEK